MLFARACGILCNTCSLYEQVACCMPSANDTIQGRMQANCTQLYSRSGPLGPYKRVNGHRDQPPKTQWSVPKHAGNQALGENIQPMASCAREEAKDPTIMVASEPYWPNV